MILSDVCLSDVCLTSVAYIGPKSRTDRPRNTKIGTGSPRHTWLGHHFQGQKVKRQGHQAALVGCSSHYMIYMDYSMIIACWSWIFMAQSALGAAGVRCVGYGLEVGRSVRTTGGAEAYCVATRTACY